jgi:hypothetical protein
MIMIEAGKPQWRHIRIDANVIEASRSIKEEIFARYAELAKHTKEILEGMNRYNLDFFDGCRCWQCEARKIEGSVRKEESDARQGDDI